MRAEKSVYIIGSDWLDILNLMAEWSITIEMLVKRLSAIES